MRRCLDYAIASLCRLVVEVFFRRIEIVGANRIPSGVPLLIVSNHTNSLIDPLLLIGCLPGHPRLLAKSTLWDQPLIAPLLRLGGAIPVFRRQDAPFDQQGERYMACNEDMFARCHDVLAAGGAIALFPEGVSHNEPKLMPLKTGVARIALEAEIKHANLGVRIVPVGLTFDARARFRSRALVQIGAPIDATLEIELYRDDPREAVNRLTARVAESLSDITQNYTSWEEARLAYRAAEIIAIDPLRGSGEELSLSKHAALSKALFEGYRLMREREPLHVAYVYDRVKAYDRLLRVFRLRTRQVTSSYGWGGALCFALHSLVVLLIRLPLTLIGIVLNYLPYRIIGEIASRQGHGADNDLAATYKVFGGFFLFPLTWIVEALIAWWLGGLALGALVLVLAPATAWIAMRSHDRRRHFLTEARAFVLLRNNHRIAEELTRRRDEIVDEIETLAARLRQD